jgi:hypothetical protein
MITLLLYLPFAVVRLAFCPLVSRPPTNHKRLEGILRCRRSVTDDCTASTLRAAGGVCAGAGADAGAGVSAGTGAHKSADSE